MEKYIKFTPHKRPMKLRMIQHAQVFHHPLTQPQMNYNAPTKWCTQLTLKMNYMHDTQTHTVSFSSPSHLLLFHSPTSPFCLLFPSFFDTYTAFPHLFHPRFRYINHYLLNVTLPIQVMRILYQTS